VTDRYTKAIEQLGSDKLDVRIGGIYALERVARDSAKDHPTVIEVLKAFIREHSHERWPPRSAGRISGAWAIDTARRSSRHHRGRAPGCKRDIQRIDLPCADLTGAHLTGRSCPARACAGADLTGAT
jgi:hypothetical protein